MTKMTTIKRLIGMSYASPVFRTGVQAVLGVVAAAVAADQWDVLNEDVWKTAFVAGIAAVIAKLQATARA
jgi:hypothetical protein